MFEKVQVGDPLEEGEHLGPVVNQAQYDKIQGLIQSAMDEGARLETGGIDRPPSVYRGYYVKPTVFSGVTPGMRIASEETFGPIATIMAYDTLEHGIEIANSTDYGLSAAISGDPAKAAEVAPRLRAGIVTINGWAPTDGAPFGGYKKSGNGREGGAVGLKDFMEVKAISGLFT
jgi:aldehyde dehydrogenase (NAD+)